MFDNFAKAIKLLINRVLRTEEKRLNPYLVGETVGPSAFSAGDWVVIRASDNAPAKVKNIEGIGVVRVILGYESESLYGETCYFANDLGYPLSEELWSASQENCYRDCHTQKHLI
jgi:hypothetical protein